MRNILCAAALMAAAPLIAMAAPVLTQDPAAFAAATSGLTFTLQDFDALPDEANLSSKDFGDFTFAATDFAIFSSAQFCRSGQCLFTVFDLALFTFDSPIRAFGFYLGDGGGLGSEVLIDGTSIGSITTPSDGFTFVGIYDLAGTFSSISLPGDLDIFDIDDVSYAAPATTGAVPLPASLPLLAAGALVLGFLRRRA